MKALIDALVKAAEKEGGIHNLRMCCGKLTWRGSVASGMLRYNDKNGSAHVIKIEEER